MHLYTSPTTLAAVTRHKLVSDLGHRRTRGTLDDVRDGTYAVQLCAVQLCVRYRSNDFTQTPTGGCHSTNQVMHARDKWPLMPPRTTHPRPLSEATEILDTDSDSDYIEGDPGDSPHRSAGSVSIIFRRYLLWCKTNGIAAWYGQHLHCINTIRH